jgi:hypothetical protein
MHFFVLYCKSYSVDVKRLVRLARTVVLFNTDRLPFYVSVPATDVPLFRSLLGDLPVDLLTDESILAANPAMDAKAVAALPGHVSQQIVKSEFWRLGLCQSYVCLDSDCLFIRPFQQSDFVSDDGTPYTVMDEGRDLLFPSLSKRKHQILKDFRRESTDVQKAFGRQGRHYNFGPNGPVWDSRVWQSLDTHMLQPQGLSFMDLIAQSPNEMRWYGEALIAYRAIRLLPCQPLFKMYHYAWQMRKDRRDGISEKELTQLYCGVVYQSAWEREMDWPCEGGNWLSHLARRLRRLLGRM